MSVRNSWLYVFVAFRLGMGPLGKPAGLAAPQIGYPFKIIIIQIPPEAKEKRKYVYDTLSPTILINPVYTPILNAGQIKDWEGCFSIPYEFRNLQKRSINLKTKKLGCSYFVRLSMH